MLEGQDLVLVRTIHPPEEPTHLKNTDIEILRTEQGQHLQTVGDDFFKKGPRKHISCLVHFDPIAPSSTLPPSMATPYLGRLLPLSSHET